MLEQALSMSIQSPINPSSQRRGNLSPKSMSISNHRHAMSSSLSKFVKSRSPLPKARLSRFCHSKLDEMSCDNFLSFIQKYDKITATQIIKEALIPDISELSKTQSLRHKMGQLHNLLSKDRESLGMAIRKNIEYN